MSQSRLTINLKVNMVADWGKTVEFLKRLDPCFVVACIDSKNDSPRIYELQKALPNAKIIARFIVIVDGDKELDGGMHLAPQAPGDNRRYVVSPGDFLNEWGYLGLNGLSLYCINEPQANKASDEDIQRLVMWSIEVINLATQRGISLVWGNFGVGHPMLLPNGQYDTRFDDVLALLSRNRELHSLGIHCYIPADIDGRLAGMIARCAAMSPPIKPPRTYITEFNYDAAFDGDPLNGHLSRGINGAQFAGREIEVLTNVYQPYIADGILEGVATFIWAKKDGRWKWFNVEEDVGWQNAIIAAKDAGKLTINARTATPIPSVPTPQYPAPLLTVGQRYTIVTPGAIRNVRSAPTLGTTEFVGKLSDGSEITALEVKAVGVDWWVKLETAEKIVGWVSCDADRVKYKAVQPPPVVIPPPVLPPPFLEVSAEKALRMSKLYDSMADTYAEMVIDHRKLAAEWRAVYEQTKLSEAA